MNPWIVNLLRSAGSGGGYAPPPTGRTFFAPLKSSLVLAEGTGSPTFTRATKAWGFNELGYLEEIASGCVFLGGARLVRNLVVKSETLLSGWTKNNGTETINSATNVTFASSSDGLTVTGLGAGAITAGAQVFVKARVWTDSGTYSIRFRAGGTYSSPISVTTTPTDCYAIITCGSSSTYGVFASGSGGTVNVTNIQINDVTSYDASYVPEYVSVGVASSPFFGAGIDGAKYYETDWQGAPIPAANLLGFKREPAATNNLLQSRNLTQTVWGSPANGGIGSELLTNGAFDSATDWTRSGAAYWSVSGGVLNLNAADSSASYYDNSQTYALLVTGKQYVVEFDYVHTSGAAPTVTLRGTDGKPLGNSTGRKTLTITCGSSVAGYGIRIGTFAAAVGTIDNLTIKEAPVQCAQTAIGIDGVANTATTLTAAVADAIILQPITLSSAARCASAYVKRRTGTGTISFTQDGGSTWTDITSQINSSAYSRVQITSTLANPSVGFKISTSGDAIDVDVVQNEAGSVATSPIVTTTATVTRNADSLTYQTASNWSDTAGTAFVEVAPLAYSGGAIGSATNGLLLSTSNSGATAHDGTNSANGPSGTPGASEKLALRWSGSAMSISSGGVIGTPGTYDGGMGLSSIGVGSSAAGCFRNVAIYDAAMDDSTFAAVTA